jgi:hypothetical protein
MIGRPTMGPYVVVDTPGRPFNVSPKELDCRSVRASPYSAVAGAMRSFPPSGFAVTKTGASVLAAMEPMFGGAASRAWARARGKREKRARVEGLPQSCRLFL